MLVNFAQIFEDVHFESTIPFKVESSNTAYRHVVKGNPNHRELASRLRELSNKKQGDYNLHNNQVLDTDNRFAEVKYCVTFFPHLVRDPNSSLKDINLKMASLVTKSNRKLITRIIANFTRKLIISPEVSETHHNFNLLIKLRPKYEGIISSSEQYEDIHQYMRPPKFTRRKINLQLNNLFKQELGEATRYQSLEEFEQTLEKTLNHAAIVMQENWPVPGFEGSQDVITKTTVFQCFQAQQFCERMKINHEEIRTIRKQLDELLA